MDLRTSKPRGPTDTEGALLLNGSTRVEFLTFFPGEGTLALSDSPGPDESLLRFDSTPPRTGMPQPPQNKRW